MIGIAHAQVDRKVRPDSPIILSERIQNLLVAVVCVTTRVSLCKLRNDVEQKIRGVDVFIITALALNEVLRRDDLAKVATELERMCSPRIADVVDNLIIVLDAKLRSIRIGANV